MRIPVALAHAHRLLNHGPTTLIAASHGGRDNVITAAWVMPLDFEPPKFAAVIAQDTWTRSLVDASGACVLMAPTTDQLDLCYALGTTSGRDLDKFAAHGLQFDRGESVPAPLLHGCAA